MSKSKLSGHIFKKGKFITPWNEFVSGLSKEESWYYGRLPEYFWLALILNFYGRQDGLSICHRLLLKLHQLAPHLFAPRLSCIFELDDSTQKAFYDYITENVSPEALAPLTCIFTYSKQLNFSNSFCVAEMPISDRMQKISHVLKVSSDHQSHFSTDIRYLALLFELFSGRFKLRTDAMGLISEYPYLSHEDEKMKLIRPTIRSFEMIQKSMETYNDSYLNLFWEEVSRMSDCEIFYIKYTEDIPETKYYEDRIKALLAYYTELFTIARPLDNKMLVLLGIATYSYKRFLELVEHQLYFTISGRSIARVLVENYIMMRYLLQEETNHEDIWTDYQYYGIGQYKLIVERIRESGKELADSYVQPDLLNLLVNEYRNKEYLDMDTNYFGKRNIREKAISVGEKDLYGFFYDYGSAFEHGLWGAIRESSLIKCNSPAHHYHCIPDIENVQKMKNVWNDCLASMCKVLSVLEDVYGCPEHLKWRL